MDLFPRNSNPVGFAYIWQSNWAGIIEGKQRVLWYFLKRPILLFMQDLNFAFLFPNLVTFFQNSSREKFANIWQIE